MHIYTYIYILDYIMCVYVNIEPNIYSSTSHIGPNSHLTCPVDLWMISSVCNSMTHTVPKVVENMMVN
jgi:hypothetical protein